MIRIYFLISVKLLPLLVVVFTSTINTITIKLFGIKPVDISLNEQGIT